MIAIMAQSNAGDFELSPEKGPKQSGRREAAVFRGLPDNRATKAPTARGKTGGNWKKRPP